MNNKITREEVISVYSGKDGACCCGCAGKHYYVTEALGNGKTIRGYEIDANEISEKMVKKVIKIINEASVVEDDGDNISTVVGSRLYVAYRKTEKK